MTNSDQSEKKRRIVKIIVDRSLCIGASSCIAVAPDIFELDSENVAIVKPNAPLDDELLLLAAQSCPTNAIFLYDEDGNQVYPEKEVPLLPEEGVGLPASAFGDSRWQAGGGVEH